MSSHSNEQWVGSCDGTQDGGCSRFLNYFHQSVLKIIFFQWKTKRLKFSYWNFLGTSRFREHLHKVMCHAIEICRKHLRKNNTAINGDLWHFKIHTNNPKHDILDCGWNFLCTWPNTRDRLKTKKWHHKISWLLWLWLPQPLNGWHAFRW